MILHGEKHGERRQRAAAAGGGARRSASAQQANAAAGAVADKHADGERGGAASRCCEEGDADALLPPLPPGAHRVDLTFFRHAKTLATGEGQAVLSGIRVVGTLAEANERLSRRRRRRSSSTAAPTSATNAQLHQTLLQWC